MPRCPHRHQPAFRLTLGLTAVLSGLLLIQAASAQDHTAPLPPPPPDAQPHRAPENPFANVPFELRVDLRKAYASPLAQTFIRQARQHGAFGDLMDGPLGPAGAAADQNPDKLDQLMQGVIDTIGLDPRTDVGEVVLRGKGVNQTDLQLVADLGASTGKLEGWMLAMPGYASDDLNDQTLLHTFFVGDDPDMLRDGDDFQDGHHNDNIHRVFAALPQGNDGHYTLVATLNRNDTVAMAEQVMAGNAVLEAGLDGDQIVSLTVNNLGEVGLPRGAYGSAILDSVQNLSFSLASGQNVTATASMTTSTPARARQVSQLLQGLIALTQLGALEEPEMQPLADFLSSVRVTQQDTGDNPGVTAQFSGSQATVEKWINFIMDNAH